MVTQKVHIPNVFCARNALYWCNMILRKQLLITFDIMKRDFT